MNTTLTRLALTASVLLALSACQKKDNSIEPPSSGADRTATAATAPSGASSPLPGVIPVQPELPQANTGAGPAHGNTAIGGMAAGQEAGGHSNAPAQPTGGDAGPKAQ